MQLNILLQACGKGSTVFTDLLQWWAELAQSTASSGTAEQELSEQVYQSSPLTQQINSIIKECLVCWKTLNGHRQVKVNHPYSRRPWSTRDGKGNSNLIARDKMITFCYHFPVPSKVAGSLLYIAQKKSLQHQAGVRYLTMPIRLEVKIQKFSSDIKYLRWCTRATKCTFHHRNFGKWVKTYGDFADFSTGNIQISPGPTQPAFPSRSCLHALSSLKEAFWFQSLLRGRQDTGPSQQNNRLPAQIAMNSGITSFQSQGLDCLKWKRSAIFNRSGILSFSVYLSI